jgi:hypothetical protein
LKSFLQSGAKTKYLPLNVCRKFTRGIPDGRATVTFTDKTKIEGNFMKGVLNGKVRQYDRYNTLQFVGLYYGGRPHGPCWVFGEDQTILVHFDQGHLVPQNVILLENKSALMGQLANDSYLEDVHQVKLENTADFKCLQVVQIPSKNVHISSETASPLPQIRFFKNYFQKTIIIITMQNYRLTAKIIAVPEEGRIIVRPAKMLYFNRVAKTGSMTFISLFNALGKKNNFRANWMTPAHDGLWEELPELEVEMKSILKIHTPTVWIRHFNFHDFKKMGYHWQPEWFAVVRDPLEKVQNHQCYILVFISTYYTF